MLFLRYIGKRLLQTVFVLFAVSVIAFLLVHLAPGSPAQMMLPEAATEEQIKEMEIKLGLDKPLIEQYWTYIRGILQGDLGTSSNYRVPVASVIADRFPSSLKLTAVASVFVLIISIPLGIIAGVNQAKPIDIIAMVFAIIGQSMSVVWLGVLNIYVFSVWLDILPSVGSQTWLHFILPALTLGYPTAALMTRMGRSGMIDVLREDYITATFAKGINRATVYCKYAFKNALIPIVTIFAVQIGQFLSASIVVETMFGIAGIGQLVNQSVGVRDYALVQSMLLIIAAIFAFLNLLVDIINSLIDPRIALK